MLKNKLKLFLHLWNQKPVLAWLYCSIGKFRINFGVHVTLAVCLPDCNYNTMWFWYHFELPWNLKASWFFWVWVYLWFYLFGGRFLFWFFYNSNLCCASWWKYFFISAWKTFLWFLFLSSLNLKASCLFLMRKKYISEISKRNLIWLLESHWTHKN